MRRASYDDSQVGTEEVKTICMGCACEDGSRESFLAVIVSVTDREVALAGLEKVNGKIPDDLFQEMFKKVTEAPPQQFSVLLMQRDGDLVGETTISGDLLPQPKEWFKARVGTVIHVVMTQLPNRRGGGLSMDVHELAQKR